ncbi:MAG: hypothetical protein IPJ46_20750 [Anaerolineales bacterium]|nr:hypothetical protein [Anaerolineales bacterium]
MKNKFSIFNFKLFYYLRQLLTNEYPDSKPETEKRKVAAENNLRWQDDGGPAVDNTRPIEQAVEDDPSQPTDVVGKDLL